jgi:hypothetical protein
MGRKRGRRLALAGGVVMLLCSTLGVVLSSSVAVAGSATLVVTPDTGLTNGQTVSVDLTTTDATPADVFIAVRQCGNADTAGTPLSSRVDADCSGSEGFGTTLKLIGFGTGAVPAGVQNVSLLLAKTNIGANKSQCLPVPPATLPCVIEAFTVLGQDPYTGPGYNFDSSTTISYDTPVTTTTGAGTTTTTAAPGTTTTTAAPATTTTKAPTTTTKAPTTTTPATTAPASTKTLTCADIPLASSIMVVSPNRCLTDGQVVTVSAPAGAHASAADVSALATTVFILQCNQDPAIVGGGAVSCNIGGLKTAVVNSDGSIPATTLSIKKGQVGSDPLSQCPPTQAQAAAGTVNCTIRAGAGGGDPAGLSTPFTMEGQTLVVAADGTPVTPAGGTTPGTQVAGETVTVAGRQLALTGPKAPTLWLLGCGIALVDMGYLALSSTWTRRRRFLFRSS